MELTLRTILLVIALALFLIAAFRPRDVEVDWVPLGYAFVVAHLLV